LHAKYAQNYLSFICQVDNWQTSKHMKFDVVNPQG